VEMETSLSVTAIDIGGTANETEKENFHSQMERSVPACGGTESYLARAHIRTQMGRSTLESGETT